MGLKCARTVAIKTNPDDETTLFRYNGGRAELRGLQSHIILGL